MSGRLVALILVILAFGALSAEALIETGYFGIFQMHMQSWAGMQVLTDLVIACLLGCIWMVRDAGARGLNAWPFVLVTLALGSFGLLFYLVFREMRGEARHRLRASSRAGSAAMISWRRASSIAPQPAISSSVRPQPAQRPDFASIAQTSMQGEEMAGRRVTSFRGFYGGGGQGIGTRPRTPR